MISIRSAAVIIFLLFTFTGISALYAEHRKILVLQSYGENDPLARQALSGIGQLPDKSINIPLYFLEQTLSGKDGISPELDQDLRGADIVVAVYRPAVRKAAAFRRENGLSYRIIAACAWGLEKGLLDKQDTNVSGIPDITATIASVRVNDRPLEKITVINDISADFDYFRSEAFRVSFFFTNRTEFSFITAVNLGNIISGITNLSGASAVLLLSPVLRDHTGAALSPYEACLILTEACSVPVLTIWDFYLGLGVTGGYLMSPRLEVMKALDIARNKNGGRFTSGRSFSGIGFAFDQRQLDRFGLKRENLPQGSYVQNAVRSGLAAYADAIRASIVVFLLLLVLFMVYAVSQKRSEKLVREQLKFQQLLIDSIPNPVFYRDTLGRVLGCNNALLGYLGREKNQIIGSLLYDIGGTANRRLYEEKEKELIRLRVVQIYEGQVQHSDGSVHDVVFYNSVFKNPSGAVGGTISVILDIKHLKKVEKELTDTLAENALLLDNIETQVWYQRNPETYGIINRAHAAFVGKPAEDIQNSRLESVLPRQSALIRVEHCTMAFGSERPLHFEEWHENFRGENRLLSVSYIPRVESDGMVRSVICSARDITLQKEMEIITARQEERFTLVLDALDEGLWDWNLSTGEVYYHPRWLLMLGYQEGEVGKSISSVARLIHPDDLFGTMRLLIRHLKGDKAIFNAEFRIRTRDGHYRWMSYRGRVTARDDNGRPLRLTGTQRDATEIHEMREKLHDQMVSSELLSTGLDHKIREVTARARETGDLMMVQARFSTVSSLLSIVTHQWAQPLNALSLLLQNLHSSARKGRTDHDAVVKASASGVEMIDFLVQTMEEFRQFFRQNTVKKQFDPSLTVEQMITFFRPGIEKRGIKLLWTKEGGCLVEGYPNEYAQAVMNLIVNARDILLERAVKEPVIELRMSVKESRRRRVTVLTVCDNGGGIEHGLLRHIFDPYYTTREKGSGIGLYLSRIMIEKRMGGRIMARNTDAGAQFIVEL